MGGAGRYNDEISPTRPRAAPSSRPHGSPLHRAKPSSSVQAAAGGESSRASARGRLRHPEGGPGTASMKTRVVTLLLAAGLLAVAALTALSIPASAQTQTVYVELADGTVVPVQVDVPPDTSLGDIQLPGTPVPTPTTPETTTTTPTAPTVTAPETTTGPAPAPTGGSDRPSSTGGSPQENSTSGTRVRRDGTRELIGDVDGRARDGISRARRRGGRSPLRNADGTPTPGNPGFVDALPGPSTATGVPNFIIRKFRVPPFLLSIYQAAGIEYGVRWEVLAAINEIETDYGRNLNVSSAGALGWMQFMPASWDAYGVDGNKDGLKDPYNPVDAIFAAARYLKAAGVDQVLLRARLIGGLPADLVGSLTGLTQGRFPVQAKATYANEVRRADLAQDEGTPAYVVDSDAERDGIRIFAKPGAPVVAVNDGRILATGHSRRLGNFVRLQDVYGNTYTYGHLESVVERYPVPRGRAVSDAQKRRELKLPPRDAAPAGPASTTSEEELAERKQDSKRPAKA